MVPYCAAMAVPHLDLHADPIDLTAALVDIPSVSQDESVIADAVEKALREQTSGFEVIRSGNASWPGRIGVSAVA